MDKPMGNLPAVSGEQSTQLSTLFGMSKPATAGEFAKHVAPLLTLVSPTGMTQDERRGWLHAAFKALGDVSPVRLELAVVEAMRTVDHPAKIVPAIRKSLEGNYQPVRITISAPVIGDGKPHHDEKTDAERQAVGQLMKGLVKQMEARDD